MTGRQGDIPLTATLVAVLQDVYSQAERKGDRLNWHQKLTSIWRPAYAPFRELLEWVPEGASVLDIGCGSGAFLFLCRAIRHARQGMGIDANVNSIALANLVSKWPELRFEVAMQARDDLVRGASVITLIDVLHHVPEEAKDAFLASVLDNAPAGSRILIKDLDPRPVWMALANRVTDYLSTRSKVDYIGRTDIERRFRAAGIKVLASLPLRKHVWSHYLVVGEKC